MVLDAKILAGFPAQLAAAKAASTAKGKTALSHVHGYIRGTLGGVKTVTVVSGGNGNGTANGDIAVDSANVTGSGLAAPAVTLHFGTNDGNLQDPAVTITSMGSGWKVGDQITIAKDHIAAANTAVVLQVATLVEDNFLSVDGAPGKDAEVKFAARHSTRSLFRWKRGKTLVQPGIRSGLVGDDTSKVQYVDGADVYDIVGVDNANAAKDVANVEKLVLKPVADNNNATQVLNITRVGQNNDRLVLHMGHAEYQHANTRAIKFETPVGTIVANDMEANQGTGNDAIITNTMHFIPV